MPDPFRLQHTQSSNPFRDAPTGLGAEMDQFVTEHPNWLFYLRRDTRFPHVGCYDPSTESPKTHCAVCFGTGYHVTLEKHCTRLDLRPDPMGSPTTAPGFLANFPALIYVPMRYVPQIRDLYFEVEWSTEVSQIEAYGSAVRLLNVYEIRTPMILRESSNSFVACGCVPYDFDFTFLQATLLERQPAE